MNKKLVYIISFLICCVNVSNVFADWFEDEYPMPGTPRYKQKKRYEELEQRVEDMEREQRRNKYGY